VYRIQRNSESVFDERSRDDYQFIIKPFTLSRFGFLERPNLLQIIREINFVNRPQDKHRT